MVQIISTTNARKNMGRLVERVRETGKAIAIGRRNKPEVLVVRFPSYNPELSDVTNLNALGDAFDFLWDEPDLYSERNIKQRYAVEGKKITRKR